MLGVCSGVWLTPADLSGDILEVLKSRLAPIQLYPREPVWDAGGNKAGRALWGAEQSVRAQVSFIPLVEREDPQRSVSHGI